MRWVISSSFSAQVVAISFNSHILSPVINIPVTLLLHQPITTSPASGPADPYLPGLWFSWYEFTQLLVGSGAAIDYHCYPPHYAAHCAVHRTVGGRHHGGAVTEGHRSPAHTHWGSSPGPPA